MEKNINICIDFNNQKPLSRWHNNIYTDNFFKDSRFSLVDWKDFKVGENNFLFFYCVPDETLQFFESMKSEFYQNIINKKIKLLFFNEQFNLFMFDGNIFNYAPNIKHNCYDINDILYWKILNLLKKHGIGEKNLFFIHTAKGFLREIEQMKTKKILWLNSTLNVESKHLEINYWLMHFFSQKQKILDKNLHYHFACLFAGRPARHRHYLIKKLCEKNLLNSGKCSLDPCPDEGDTFQLPMDELRVKGLFNSHFKNTNLETETFRDIFLWVAGETYCPNGYPYFTEKTLKPIFHERPFISYGNPGTLAYLRDYGFQTFNDYWDESYDNEKDDDKKIEIIANIIQGICKKKIFEINRMYDDMKPILEHNKNLLVNTDWRKELVSFLS